MKENFEINNDVPLTTKFGVFKTQPNKIRGIVIFMTIEDYIKVIKSTFPPEEAKTKCEEIANSGLKTISMPLTIADLVKYHASAEGLESLLKGNNLDEKVMADIMTSFYEMRNVSEQEENKESKFGLG